MNEIDNIVPAARGGQGPRPRRGEAKPASLAMRSAELKRPASLAMRTAQSERAKRASARRQRVTVGGQGLPSGPSAGSLGGRPGRASIGRNHCGRNGLGVRRGFVSGHPPSATWCRGSQSGRVVGGGGGWVGGGACSVRPGPRVLRGPGVSNPPRLPRLRLPMVPVGWVRPPPQRLQAVPPWTAPACTVRPGFPRAVVPPFVPSAGWQAGIVARRGRVPPCTADLSSRPALPVSGLLRAGRVG
jgi:hypothetical protein